MRLKLSRHIVAIGSLLLFLLTGQVGVQGYVWCLGDEGHAALESVAGSSCAPGGNAPNRPCQGDEFPDLFAQQENCGPCFDIPASLEATCRITREQRDLSAPLDLPAILAVSAVPSFARVPLPNRCPPPPPRITQTLLFQRTVVLLT
ncbi:hypothetical protein DSOUD_2902 [Desulfuromonas soudanensis]|uniref:Uncharacterized protein n=1 Tax=Desulfuromonas soudanensis TaxID=1603606 RepID=A0A0M4DK76_9BACT|nr:hypothetical protein [Desulfuromonas soudanensis]ALC17632.1 hypothetical protein DSOUD_2902 [Desulfuromonas soudanensis]